MQNLDSCKIWIHLNMSFVSSELIKTKQILIHFIIIIYRKKYVSNIYIDIYNNIMYVNEILCMYIVGRS
jgi:hypothetical protein